MSRNACVVGFLAVMSISSFPGPPDTGSCRDASPPVPRDAGASSCPGLKGGAEPLTLPSGSRHGGQPWTGTSNAPGTMVGTSAALVPQRGPQPHPQPQDAHRWSRAHRDISSADGRGHGHAPKDQRGHPCARPWAGPSQLLEPGSVAEAGGPCHQNHRTCHTAQPRSSSGCIPPSRRAPCGVHQQNPGGWLPPEGQSE